MVGIETETRTRTGTEARIEIVVGITKVEKEYIQNHRKCININDITLILCYNIMISRPQQDDKGHKISGGEESEESELDEESELMKKIMGFNKFDTTKVCGSIFGYCSQTSSTVHHDMHFCTMMKPYFKGKPHSTITTYP